MKAQHTPGPWVVAGSDAASGPGYVMTRGGTYVAKPLINCEANARLIAAAPEYDAAARLALPIIEHERQCFFECHTAGGDPATLDAAEKQWLDEYDAAITALKAAIAKAEGRP